MRCMNLKMGTCNTNVLWLSIKHKWSCSARSMICRNCTWWHFPRAYDIVNQINPSIPAGISGCMPYTTFC